MTIVNGEASYLDQHQGPKRSVGDLDVTLSLPSLDGPLTAAGTATYNAEPVKFAGSVASPSAVRGGGASAATLDIGSARESFSFAGRIDGADPVAAHGTVEVKAPSLRDLLAWVGIAPAPTDNGLGRLSLDGKIDGDGARLTLSDATIALDGVAATGTFVLTRTDGRFELDFHDLALSGGKATGQLVADDSGPTPSLAASVTLTGITVHQLALNIAGFDTLSGTGDVAVDLTASGSTMRALAASLNGTGRVDFADGAIGSAGLGPLLKNALGPAIGDKAIPREIAYRSLSASATIAQGVLHNSDLKLVGSQVSATGAGTLDLAPHRIDYLWQPDIAGLGSARVAISGDWGNPDYKVNSVTVTKGLAIPGLKLR
jgi:uncharacterized protein involved in outer membrane biogenesis